jgi:uncharacterized membrane protein
MDYLLGAVTELSLEKTIYYLLGFICHQDKSILLGIGENFIPLCPRCLGLHSGFFIALIVIKLLFQKPINLNRPKNILVITFSISLAGIHWLLGFLGIMEMDLTSRILTGLVSGAGFSILLNSLKYKYLQTVFKIPIRNKNILVYLTVLLVCICLLSNYDSLIFIILVLVTSNIISIIHSIWTIIRQNKIYYPSFEIKKEMQL